MLSTAEKEDEFQEERKYPTDSGGKAIAISTRLSVGGETSEEELLAEGTTK